jgi:hypothetical protein
MRTTLHSYHYSEATRVEGCLRGERILRPASVPNPAYEYPELESNICKREPQKTPRFVGRGVSTPFSSSLYRPPHTLMPAYAPCETETMADEVRRGCEV